VFLVFSFTNLKISQTNLIFFTILFIACFDNYSFFQNVIKVYPLDNNFSFVVSLFVLLIAFNTLLFTLLSSKFTTKPVLITILIVSSLTNYFMNSYHIVIDDDMIRNAIQTDTSESLDLVTIKQILYLIFLGLIPSYLVYKANIKYSTLKIEILSKIKYIIVSILIIIICLVSFSKYYTSFFREHKPLRYSINPTYWIYSIGKYINKTFNNGPIVVKEIGLDAKIVDKENKQNDEHPELIIMVVGEAARADHFSLNGYEKETNPLLKKEDIINLSNMYSCGTSTAHSVPCMFSIFGRDDYNYKKGISTQNILDVLNHTKEINILWRDNNSDSKGVATRVPFENFKKSNKESESRDEEMLVGLDKYIEKNKGKDTLIVLHQMGNHGPAYYKRYPKEFEKFTPTCKTNQLENCTQEEISNAYDNALLYTDYFLAKTINFLKQYDKTHETALVYIADHGESLGENGIYLHGLPYFMAPEHQKHVGAFLWFGENIKQDIDIEKIILNKDKKFSQDNLFHTLLGLFEVNTKVYDKSKDIINANN
jgi:lipid A ethanolaminephosphotransferase